jgi:hypothetical protein
MPSGKVAAAVSTVTDPLRISDPCVQVSNAVVVLKAFAR